MLTVCSLNKCCNCQACLEVCPKSAITIRDKLKYTNAIIDEVKCINCNLCKNICPIQNQSSIVYEKPIFCKQGWATDLNIRKNSSSGGLATAISYAFIRNGGCVCSCYFSSGEFLFGIAETTDELRKFVGSKYVKSSTFGIYKQINNKLKSFKPVLFIGLPCQVAAVNQLFKDKYNDLLYTIDLICHGTPSQKVFDIFLKDNKISKKDIKDISFRKKTFFRIQIEKQKTIPVYIQDEYTYAFLNSLTYTENCYDCKFAKLERCSDITLGDSWGSDLDEIEKQKGISIILCQTNKGIDILKKSECILKDVNIENEVKRNHQLEYPSVAPAERNNFFNILEKTNSLKKAMFVLYPKHFIRQYIKKILYKFKLNSK